MIRFRQVLIVSFMFPLWFLLIAYGVFLIVFVAYSAFTVYHLVRFGVYGRPLFTIIAVYILITTVAIVSSIYLFSKFNWTTPVDIDGSVSFPPTDSFSL